MQHIVKLNKYMNRKVGVSQHNTRFEISRNVTCNNHIKAVVENTLFQTIHCRLPGLHTEHKMERCFTAIVHPEIALITFIIHCQK